MHQSRKLRLILAAVLYASCLLSNLFSFLNIELGFIVMTPFRVVVVITSAICLLFLKKEQNLIGKFRSNKLIIAAMAFFVVTALYGVFWVLLGQTGSVAKTEVMGVLTISMFVFCSFVLIRTKSDVALILKLCVGIGLILAVLAHIEAIFGSFVPGTRNYYSVGEKLAMGQVFFSPTSVFYNQNDFAAFLLLDYAVLCGWIVKAKSRKEFLWLIAIAALLISPTPLIGSSIFNLAAAFLTVLTVGLLLLQKKDNIKVRVKKGVCVALAMVLFGFALAPIIQTAAISLNRSYFLWRLEMDPDIADVELPEDMIPEDVMIDNGLAGKLDAAHSSQGTIYIRYRLITAGLEMVKQAPLTGYGPGGYRLQMAQDEETLLKTRAIVDPHCFYIELLAQYGLVLFVAYMAVVLYCFVVLLRRTLRELKNGIADSATPLLLLAAFSIAVIIPSSVLRLFPVWMFFSLFVIPASEQNRQKLQMRQQ